MELQIILILAAWILAARYIGEALGFALGRMLFTRHTANLCIALWITGCGYEPKEEMSDDKEEATEKTVAPTTEGIQEQTPATEEDDMAQQALLVQTSADLPACRAINKRQLVYVQEDEVFMTCNGKYWDHVEIDTQGVAGPAGKDGAAGGDGRDGRDGEDAPYIGPDEWLDPVSKKKWFLGQSFSVSQVPNLEYLCSSPARSPAPEEIAAAGKTGLYERYRSSSVVKRFWVGHGPYTTYGVTYEHQGQVLQLLTSASIMDGAIDFASPVSHPAASSTYYRTLCVID